MMQYQYGAINVLWSLFSGGFDFRCVASLQQYDVDNKDIQDKVHPMFDTDELKKKFDHEKYYKNVLHVCNQACKGN